MRNKHIKPKIKTAIRAFGLLSFAAVAAFGQQSVSLTAGPSSVTMPDGSSVPMWGYTCGSTAGGATCKSLNPTATAGTWSPVVITAVPGVTLTINLTNNLSFPNGNK